MSDKTKYIEMFIEEAQEQLEILNRVLLDIENKDYSSEFMNSAYRIVHTIKGSASVLGIDIIRDFTHTMEDLFDLLREKDMRPDKESLDLLFRGSDIIENMIGELSTKGKVKTKGKNVLEMMKAMIEELSEDNDRIKNSNDNAVPESFELSDKQIEDLRSMLTKGKSVYELLIPLMKKIRFKEGRIFQLLKMLGTTGDVIATIPEKGKIDDNISLVKILFITDANMHSLKNVAGSITGVKSIEIKPFELTIDAGIKSITGQNLPLDEEETSPKGRTGFLKTETIRVKSKLLDKLLDLVGEIMISNIRVKKIVEDLKNKELKQALKNEERLIGDLQDTVLRIRMVPVEHIFKRFPRMVRDMAKEAGKEVKFDIVGFDIEIDRSLLDDTGDALVHLLRNAVDHGIESEEERIRKVKDSICNIKLSAYTEKSSIIITVEDDGRGFDIKKLREKVIARNLFDSEEVMGMDDRSILQLAFQPGISTAEKVTEISGRGVGLDAVKSKIESLGGTVRLESNEGKGTKFTIKLPPSMSIISAMLVEINDENYAVPLENLSETTKLMKSDVHEFLRNGMFRLRDEVLPLLDVHSEFGGDIASFERDLPIIIVEKDDSRAGLVVSRLIGQQEIVVKNLSRDLKHSRYFSGATILGDGNVALILDIGALL